MLTAVLEIFNIIHTYNNAKEYYRTAGPVKKVFILLGVAILAGLSLGAIYLAFYLFNLNPDTSSVIGAIFIKIFCWIGGIALIVSSVVMILKSIMYFLALIFGILGKYGKKEKETKSSRGFNVFMAILTVLVFAGYILGAVYLVKYLFLLWGD